MPLVLADRVRETTTTTGTGTISLAGPVSGFQGFSTAIGNANTTYYTIVDAATGAWEVGLGTYTSAGSTLARTTVLSSSNSDALVPFGAGTKDVFVTQPAERAVYVLGAGTGLAAGAAAFTANGIPYASATNTLTTGSALTFDGTNLGVGGGGDPFGRFYGRSAGISSASSAFLEINAATGSSSGIDFGVNASRTAGITSNTTETNFTTLGATPLLFGINGSEQMRLTSTGLGIGTSSPANKLVVSNAGANGFEVDPANSLMQTYNRSGGAYTSMNLLALSMAFKTGASPATTMLLDSSGNLGIGTSSPGSKLHIDGNFIRIEQSGANTAYFGNAGDLISGAPAGAAIRFNNTALRIAFGSTQIAMFDSSGNLGIGTTSLGAKLDIVGASSNQIRVGSAATEHYRIGRNASDGLLDFYGSQTGFQGYRFGGIDGTWATINSSGNLGLGVTPSAWSSTYKGFEVGALGNGFAASAATDIQFVSNAYYDGGWKYAQTGTKSATAFAMQDVAYGQVEWWSAGGGAAHTKGDPITFTQAMTLDASGRLGVGVTSVEEKLHVAAANPTNGVLQFIQNTSTSAQTGALIKMDVGNVGTSAVGIPGGTSNAIAFYVGGVTSGSERARIDSSGNFLVGTTNAGGASGPGVKVLPAANGTDGPQLAIVTAATTNSTASLAIYSAGAAAYRFYVTDGGTVYATNTTISAISDQRFKENIQDLDVGLEKIMALKPRKFDWKSGKGKDIKGDRGFIAQELEQVFPDLVDEWADPAPEGEQPYKSVRQDLIPVLVKAIQELKADLDATKAELAALKGAHP
jgi:hypothetical protein